MPRCVSVMKTYSEISLRKRRGHESVSIGTKNMLDRFAHWIPIWLLVLDCSPCSNNASSCWNTRTKESPARKRTRLSRRSNSGYNLTHRVACVLYEINRHPTTV